MIFSDSTSDCYQEKQPDSNANLVFASQIAFASRMARKDKFRLGTFAALIDRVAWMSKVQEREGR